MPFRGQRSDGQRYVAKLAGEEKYFTGRPCIRGHVALRWTRSGHCDQCRIDEMKKRESDWTEEQTRSLRELYPRAGWSEILAKVGRPKRSCQDQASKLRIKRLSMLDLAREARARGGLKFVCDAPCASGHIGERYSRDAICVVCNSMRTATFGKKNRPELRVKERYRRAKNPEKWRAKGRRRYAKNRDVIRSQNRVRLASLTDEQKQRYANRRKAYYRENIKKIRANIRAYRAAHPEVAKVALARRRARLKNASGSHGIRDLREILKLQKDKCAYCRISLRSAGKHLDHIISLSVGGSNDRSNLQFLCPPCNIAKSNKDPIMFSRERGMLL